MGGEVVLRYRFSEDCFDRPFNADELKFDYYASILEDYAEFAGLIRSSEDGFYLLNMCSPLAPLILRYIEVVARGVRSYEVNDLMSALVIRGVLVRFGVGVRLELEESVVEGELYDFVQSVVVDTVHELTIRDVAVSPAVEEDGEDEEYIM